MLKAAPWHVRIFWEWKKVIFYTIWKLPAGVGLTNNLSNSSCIFIKETFLCWTCWRWTSCYGKVCNFCPLKRRNKLFLVPEISVAQFGVLADGCIVFCHGTRILSLILGHLEARIIKQVNSFFKMFWRKILIKKWMQTAALICNSCTVNNMCRARFLSYSTRLKFLCDLWLKAFQEAKYNISTI